MPAARLAFCIAIGCANAALTHAATAQPRTAQTETAQKQPPPSTYSRAEIDKKIDQLRKEILATVPSEQELEDRLATLYSKSDIDTQLDKIRKSLQQTISQAELTTMLTTANNDAKVREQSLKNKIQILDSRIPKISPWAAIIAAACGTIVSLAVGIASGLIAHKARTQARTLAANATASEYEKEWSESIGKKCANVISALKGKGPITDKFNDVADVFNWFDRLAGDVTNARVTEKIIQRAQFKKHAADFWNALQTRESDPELKPLREASDDLKAYIDRTEGVAQPARPWRQLIRSKIGALKTAT